MSIFGRDEAPEPVTTPQPTTPAPAPTKGPARVTLISAGTKVEGEISGATEVKIDGNVDGTLNVDALVTVGKQGQVRGEIHGKSVAVEGKVIGNILGGDKVDISPSGKLEGDVRAPRVSIADGAYFKGRVEMTGDATPAAPEHKAKSPEPAVKPAAKPAAQPTLDAIKASKSGQ